MSYFFIQIDQHKNIVGWGNKSGQFIENNISYENTELMVDQDIINLLQKNSEIKHKYINNTLINTGESIFPTNQYSIWDNNLNKWVDPRPQTAIIAEKWTQVRNQRDALLIESDWTDTLSAKARLGDALYNAWQNYRQALRDVTNQADPFTITWPTKPQ